MTKRLSFPDPRILLLAAVAMALVAGLVVNTSTDPDLWGHVLFGRDIVRERHVPRVDPYSFTSDRDWVNHEWLAEVAMYSAYAAAGNAGLIGLKLLLCLATTGLVIAVLYRHPLSFEARAFLATLAVLGVKPATGHIRPQLFSVLLFTVLLVLLTKLERPERRAWVMVPIVMLVWANLHGGWIVGLGVLALWIGATIIRPDLSMSRRAGLAAVAMAAAIATLGTPYGIELWAFLVGTVRFARSEIQDWQPITAASFGIAATWAFVAASTLVLIVRTRKTTDLRRVLILTLLAGSSFQVNRLTPFFALAAAIFFAAPLGAVSGADGRRHRPATSSDSKAAIVTVSAAALCCIAVAVVATVRSFNCIAIDAAAAPEREAAAFILRNRLEGRMVTWFDWGEYAIWHFSPALRVSMDGRRETVYSDAQIAAHLRLYRDTGADSEAQLRAMAADYVWVPKTARIVAGLRRWQERPAFEGSRSIIFALRNDRAFEQPPESLSAPRCFPGP